MFSVAPALKVYLHRDPVDGLKVINRLEADRCKWSKESLATYPWSRITVSRYNVKSMINKENYRFT